MALNPVGGGGWPPYEVLLAERDRLREALELLLTHAGVRERTHHIEVWAVKRSVADLVRSVSRAAGGTDAR